MQILIADGDEQYRRHLRETLAARFYVVEEAGTGADALELGANAQFEGIILDARLPDLDATAVLRQWRAKGIATPVLLTREHDTWRDRVEALRAGADDCLGKPFEPEEMLARLEAIIRRAHGKCTSRLEFHGLEIDPAARSVRYCGDEVSLTALEFRTLYYLGLNTGRVVSQSELIEHIYNQEIDLGSNVIEVVVSRIRRKLDRGIIHTRRGHGYVVSAQESLAS